MDTTLFPTGLPPVQKTDKKPELVTDAIAAIDFNLILALLTLPTSGDGEYGWTEDEAVERVAMYRRFLYLKVTSDFVVVPNRWIDAIWHLHLADTRKYEADCMAAFGFFLHHFPYLGMRGEEDERMLAELFERSAVLYENVFGGDYFIPNEVGSGGASCG